MKNFKINRLWMEMLSYRCSRIYLHLTHLFADGISIVQIIHVTDRSIYPTECDTHHSVAKINSNHIIIQPCIKTVMFLSACVCLCVWVSEFIYCIDELEWNGWCVSYTFIPWLLCFLSHSQITLITIIAC